MPTAYDVQGVVEADFEGAKMLVRIDLEDPATTLDPADVSPRR